MYLLNPEYCLTCTVYIEEKLVQVNLMKEWLYMSSFSTGVMKVTLFDIKSPNIHTSDTNYVS